MFFDFCCYMDDAKHHRFENIDTGSDYSDGFGALIFWGIFIAVVLSGFILYITLKRRKERMVPLSGHSAMVDSSLIRTVTLVSEGAIQVVKGDVFVAPFLEKEGYDFNGWFYDTACTIPYINKKISKDITLYPKWVKHS